MRPSGDDVAIVTAVTIVTVAARACHTSAMTTRAQNRRRASATPPAARDIEIELGTPARVQSQPARHQSLWLLLRLWQASQSGEGWVRESQVRERFPNARHLRMIVSRAYGDFAQWGLRVGWGIDRERDPDLLPLAGRSRGPYWLADGEAARLRLRLHGEPADAQAVAAWLGATASPATALSTEATSRASPAYWHAWAGARRDMLDGRLILDREHGALAGYRRAQHLTDDPWLQALALLQQAAAGRPAHLSLVASVAGYRGLPNALAYGPTKAALINLAEVLYLDLHARGVGMSLVNPGFVDTPLTAQNTFHMPALITPEAAAQAIVAGWAKGTFEIHFPKRFTRLLKAMRLLPDGWYFGAVRRAVGV